MTSTDNEDDPSFLALATHLRRRIDSAFDSVTSSGTELQSSGFEISAGGYVVEQPEPGPSHSAVYEPGWFVVEDLSSASFSAKAYISLSEIPRALNLLELYPDDDIMSVFKNAAAGWGVQNRYSNGVSRKDWRAICAALFEGEHVEGSDKEDPAGDEDIGMDMDGGPDSDEYQAEELSDDVEGATSDEYGEPGRTTAGPRKSRQISRMAPTTSSATETSKQLTESQKAHCRQDFGRFFPHVPDNELDHQRITIKDITRVADLLKENLRTEEILEMLDAFSTSPDKSMNLADFERMMVLTKLV